MSSYMLRFTRAFLHYLHDYYPSPTGTRHVLWMTEEGDLFLRMNIAHPRGPLSLNLLLEEEDLNKELGPLIDGIKAFVYKELLDRERANLLTLMLAYNRDKCEREYRLQYPKLGSF